MNMDFTKNKIPSEINVTPPYQLMVIHSSKLIYQDHYIYDLCVHSIQYTLENAWFGVTVTSSKGR